MIASTWSEEALDAIHLCSLGILERIGLRVDLPEARQILLDARCTLGSDGRVRVPRELVDETLAACPRSFTMMARNRERSLAMDPDPGPTYVHTFRGCPDVADPDTGERRRATLLDAYQHARVMQGLPHQHAVTEFFEPDDVPLELHSLYALLANARESDKFIRGPGMLSPFQARHVCEIARALHGQMDNSDSYGMDFAFSPVSPLFLDPDCSAALIETARRGGMVIECMPCGVAGTTAPASIAGAVATQNAEILGAIVLTEAIRPGTPVYYSARLIVCDPRTGGYAAGSPEMGLMSIPATLLARRYGLACDCYGPSGSSIVTDAQHGYENGFNTLLGLVAQPRLLSGCGDTQAGLGSSLELLVLHDEIVNYSEYILKDHPWDAAALDVDAIGEGVLNPSGYLMTKHTRQYMRKEFLAPELSWRGNLSQWERTGYHGIADLARERARELLANEPVGLPADADERMCGVIDAAARDLGLDEWPDPRIVPDGVGQYEGWKS